MLLPLHHVQLAMPEGKEDDAIAFYHGILGLPVVEKPDALRHRGGVWFERAGLRVHLGVEKPFSPARKAHPAFQVASLTTMIAALEAASWPWREDIDLPGLRRLYVDDPFSKRIELLELSRSG